MIGDFYIHFQYLVILDYLLVMISDERVGLERGKEQCHLTKRFHFLRLISPSRLQITIISGKI